MAPQVGAGNTAFGRRGRAREALGSEWRVLGFMGARVRVPDLNPLFVILCALRVFGVVERFCSWAAEAGPCLRVEARAPWRATLRDALRNHTSCLRVPVAPTRPAVVRGEEPGHEPLNPRTLEPSVLATGRMPVLRVGCRHRWRHHDDGNTFGGTTYGVTGVKGCSRALV
jgi:hypothetical protein